MGVGAGFSLVGDAKVCLTSSEHLCYTRPLTTAQCLWLAVKENNGNPNAEICCSKAPSILTLRASTGQPCLTLLCMAPSITPEVTILQYYFFQFSWSYREDLPIFYSWTWLTGQQRLFLNIYRTVRWKRRETYSDNHGEKIQDWWKSYIRFQLSMYSIPSFKLIL